MHYQGRVDQLADQDAALEKYRADSSRRAISSCSENPNISDHIPDVTKMIVGNAVVLGDCLQFLTWFENRAKCDMSQEDWNKVKLNIKDYLI